MRSFRKFAFLLVFGACFLMISCVRPQAFAQQDNGSVLQIAHEYRQGNQPSRVVPTKLQVERPVPSSQNMNDEDSYEEQIRAFFNQQNFDQLERAAHEARVGKGRFVGGVWKLFAFYDAVAKIPAGKQSTEADWTARLTTLKKWAATQPGSVTARVALAETYVNYAWDGRGSGYSDTVTENGWKLFGERAELSRSTLVEAAKLKDKCPYWYEAMQHVALAQGWDKSQTRELMEQAVLFEPGYYHFYREYAYFLEPKWYGEERESEAFAEEISDRVGGQQGAFLYFEIASLLTCQCNPDPAHMANLSWPKIKKGYAALGQLYGVSSLKRNRFAYMATLAADKPAAREAFAQIGDNWDKDIWRTREYFESTKAWAINP
jgi:hypothetical protein